MVFCKACSVVRCKSSSVLGTSVGGAPLSLVPEGRAGLFLLTWLASLRLHGSKSMIERLAKQSR